MIPTFNASRFLPDALESIIAQSVPPSSILVVDDASTDGSGEVAERYTALGHPVRCIRLERNGGPATARNVALREADEPLVAFLDADDVWLPDHCRTMTELLGAHPEAVLAYGRVAPFDAPIDGAIDGAADDAAGGRPAPARPRDHLEELLFDSRIPQSAVVARRESLLRAGGYTEGMRHAEDFDLWLRLCLEGPFVDSGVATCLRRRHDGQATRQSALMFRGAWEARRRFREVADRRGGLAGGLAGDERYDAICAAAFHRDLTWAWQSRRRDLLRDVLALAPLVPGGGPVARRWQRRDRLAWPLWRAAAWLWDRKPRAMPERLRALRRQMASWSA